MINTISKALCFLFFLASSPILNAQTPISGIVNEYFEVQTINIDSNFVSLEANSNLLEGDRVLIIQMQGAMIDESQSSSFGSIENYAEAGNYEFHRVCFTDENKVYFENAILNSYHVDEAIQLIYVPNYSSVILTDTLTGMPWNGTVGGVLAIEVDSVLDMGNSNIDMSFKGFQGGEGAVSDDDCNWTLNLIYTYYQNFNTEPSSRGRKGEGIAKIISGKECGIGPQANGGGGGNNHNGGAGGGSNYGIGGRGGERIPLGTFNCNAPMGLPSISVNSGYNSNKIFLGGGGGAGHGNNPGTTGENGGNGGGIIFIKANEIIGSELKISSNGGSVVEDATDGGAGGGAGGTLVLDVEIFTGNLTLEVEGGSGAEVINGGLSNCNGPGGGGGGGAILTTLSSLPTNVTTNFEGGLSGTITATDQTNCVIGSQNSAQNGTSGAVLNDWDLVFSEEFSIACLPDCLLPDVPELDYYSVDICEGEETTVSILSGNLNGADHWNWFAGDCTGEEISSGDSLTVTLDLDATFYVAGVGGCLTDTIYNCAVVEIMTHPSYETNATTNLCDEEQIIFNGELISEAGLYSIELLSEYGCDSVVNLNVTTTAIDNGIVFNEIFISAIQEDASYSWINCENNEVFVGENSMTFYPEFTGEYAVEVTVGDCSGISDCVSFVNNVSIEENIFENEILIYPIPTSDYINIDLSQVNEESNLILFNTLGKKVLDYKLIANSNNQVVIDWLASGTYFGTIVMEERLMNFKIIVE